MRSRINLIYCDMKQRCYNTKHEAYKNYGGRGITICDEWNDREKIGYTSKGFMAFQNWALSHGYKDGLTIDRIDNNKGYNPKNCRWIQPKAQSNNKRNNRLITYKGSTQTLKQWCEELKLNYPTTRMRLERGWSVARTFETKEDCRKKEVTYLNKTQSLIDWCKELNLPYSTIKARLFRYHWSVEKAFGGTK